MIIIEEFDTWVKSNINDRNSVFRKTLKNNNWLVYGVYISNHYELSVISSDVKVDGLVLFIEFVDPFGSSSSVDEPFNLSVRRLCNSKNYYKSKIITSTESLTQHIYDTLDIKSGFVEVYDYASEDDIKRLWGEEVF